jgi:hypothetical protein
LEWNNDRPLVVRIVVVSAAVVGLAIGKVGTIAMKKC